MNETGLRIVKQAADSPSCCQLWLILALLLLSVRGYAAGDADALQLECNAIPGHPDQLCVAVNANHYGPYDDVAVYRKPANGAPVLLHSYKNGVARFAGFGFSKEGRYMWEAWAEEGHPYFVFYLSDDYLKPGRAAESLGNINDYWFDHFSEFGDDGKVTYVLTEDALPSCQERGGVSLSAMETAAHEASCVKYLFLSQH